MTGVEVGNRTGTYIAFDGLGKVNPTESDFRYYSVIQGWDANKKIEFNFTNSHEKTYAVRDTSSLITLQSRIRERLSLSKNMVVILSSDTRKSGSLLSYEIEQAVDVYKLPLIISYVDFDIVAKPESLHGYWPKALKDRIDNGSAKAIHIGFKKEPILDAIGQFSVNDKQLPMSLCHYSEDAYRSFGLSSTILAGFVNKEKAPINSAYALSRFYNSRL